MFALGISDFSVGEGVYPAAQLLRVARSLGYRDLVCWDNGLAGYPKLRDTLAWIDQARALEGANSVQAVRDHILKRNLIEAEGFVAAFGQQSGVAYAGDDSFIWPAPITGSSIAAIRSRSISR